MQHSVVYLTSMSSVIAEKALNVVGMPAHPPAGLCSKSACIKAHCPGSSQIPGRAEGNVQPLLEGLQYPDVGEEELSLAI